MTAIFESEFHRRYVGGEGVVVEVVKPLEPRKLIFKTKIEDVLAEYRKYVGDPNADLPEEIMNTLLI